MNAPLSPRPARNNPSPLGRGCRQAGEGTARAQRSAPPEPSPQPLSQRERGPSTSAQRLALRFATIPALSLVDNNDESRFSSYFVENGSYMKLRNVEIGYTIPRSIKGIDAIKIYLMGENLLTVYKKNGAGAFTGPDPELPGSDYPIPRKLTAGVNLSF